MYVLKFSHASTNFKIKSKADVKTFLEEIFDSGEVVLILSKDHCLFIRKRKHEGNLIQVAEKLGNLHDPFNPEFVLDEERAIDILYKERKFINQAVLGD